MKTNLIQWIKENTIFNKIEKTNDFLKGYILHSDIYDLNIYVHYSKTLNTYYIDNTEEYKGIKEFKKALQEF